MEKCEDAVNELTHGEQTTLEFKRSKCSAMLHVISLLREGHDMVDFGELPNTFHRHALGAVNPSNDLPSVDDLDLGQIMKSESTGVQFLATTRSLAWPCVPVDEELESLFAVPPSIVSTKLITMLGASGTGKSSAVFRCLSKYFGIYFSFNDPLEKITMTPLKDHLTAVLLSHLNMIDGCMSFPTTSDLQDNLRLCGIQKIHLAIIARLHALLIYVDMHKHRATEPQSL